MLRFTQSRTFKECLPAVLGAIPDDWRGTTYKNANLLGRAAFANNLSSLAASGEPITVESVAHLGISEDYFRVSSNMTTTLEHVLAEESGLPIDQIFTFGSNKMNVVAVALVVGRAGSHVDLYVTPAWMHLPV